MHGELPVAAVAYNMGYLASADVASFWEAPYLVGVTAPSTLEELHARGVLAVWTTLRHSTQ